MSVPSYSTDLATAARRATAQASARWTAATAPRRGGRIVTAAALAWEAAYPIAYRHGYRTLADRLAAAANDLHARCRHTSAPSVTGPAVDDALASLVATARAAAPTSDAGAPPPREVLGLAALAALDRLDGRTAPEAITGAVHRQAVRYGAMQGVLTAAADIRTRWGAQTDPAALSTPAEGTPLGDRVDTILGRLNRDVVTELLADVAGPTHNAALNAARIARSSFAAAATARGQPPTDATVAHPVADHAPRRSRS